VPLGETPGAPIVAATAPLDEAWKGVPCERLQRRLLDLDEMRPDLAALGAMKPQPLACAIPMPQKGIQSLEASKCRPLSALLLTQAADRDPMKTQQTNYTVYASDFYEDPTVLPARSRSWTHEHTGRQTLLSSWIQAVLQLWQKFESRNPDTPPTGRANIPLQPSPIVRSRNASRSCPPKAQQLSAQPSRFPMPKPHVSQGPQHHVVPAC
jgi:hypothetical protein